MTSLSTPQTTTRPRPPPEDERIERLRQAAYRIRRNALNMGEVQGQGYIGQALGVADVLAVAYIDQLSHRPDDPHWPDRDRFLLSIGHYAIALYAALAEAGIIPVEELETYGSDDSRLPMSGMASYTPGHGDLRRLPRATVWPSPPAWPWGCATRATRPGCSTCSPTASSTRARPGRPRWSAPTTAWTTSPRSSTSTPCRPTVPRPASWGPSRSPRSGRPSAGMRCAWTATTSPALVDAFDELRAHRGSPGVLICDTRIGRGVPLLETREKAHFMRVAEHEWQIARDQLAAATTRKD